MLGIETIREMSNVAAYEAAQEARVPLVVEWPEDAHGLPFLGEYVPEGWRQAVWADLSPASPRVPYRQEPEEAAGFMVDSSGFGQVDEPALPYDERVALIREATSGRSDIGWGIRVAGESQVVVQAYAEDPGSPG